MYDYDYRSASRVTFGKFGRLDDDGGTPAAILLDGVEVGEIARVVETTLKGVSQRTFIVKAYVPSFQGPILDNHSLAALDEKETPDLPKLKQDITRALGGLPEGVSEVYRLYRDRKITNKEWQDKVKDLI